ncbi:MAG: iron-containing redox enzyme family protein [Halomonadaceae bacterium]|nr:MAG: iron-containing redox enzyme family protein [Halomonadaceae bacterium]
MPTQKQLYLYNRQRLQFPMLIDEELLRFEQQWIGQYLGPLEKVVTDFSHWKERFQQLMAMEAAATPESAQYVGHHMTREEFSVLVQEFAVDGLTEAQAFYFILPRLPFAAQMPMLRIMIDEFGCGNLKRAHSTLYIHLLEELEMPVTLEHYIECIEEPGFAFVNLFLWLTRRPRPRSFYAGAITYLETVIPRFFTCYVQACDRLAIKAHAYYSEHCHIDAFHAEEGQRLLRTLHKEGALNADHAWQGVCLAAQITEEAFETAVSKARQGGWEAPRKPREGAASCQ